MAKLSWTIIKRRLAPHLPVLAKIAIALVGVLLLFSLTKLITKFPIPKPLVSLEEHNHRTNFLVLGKGGASHETPDLTDTIIVASYHHPTKATTLIPLPRDLWIDSLRAKINTAYYYGNLKKPGGGLILAKASVAEVIDQPIHYTAVVDFNTFKTIIDLVGGVEIDIPATFDDYKYPIPGQETAEPETARYEHLHFDRGMEIMDGARALKYVRSRNAEGDQGTDFARSARQQQVILALQKKLLSTNTLLKPQKLSSLLSLVSQSIETNFPPNAIPAFIKLALQFDRQKVVNLSLEDLLISPPPKKYQGQWVLTGQNGTWQEVQQYVQNQLYPN